MRQSFIHRLPNAPGLRSLVAGFDLKWLLAIFLQPEVFRYQRKKIARRYDIFLSVVNVGLAD